MNASEQYHQPALEALCAFVRDNTKDYKGDGPPATDIQAALTVIGRRKPGEGHVDLTGARVPKAVFPNPPRLWSWPVWRSSRPRHRGSFTEALNERNGSMRR